MLRRALICVLLLSACSQPIRSDTAERSTEQVLTIPVQHDVQSLDPATMGILAPDIGIGQNVFGGLYKFDADLREVTDIAQGPSDVSQDGLTYMFHLRRAAGFSNGDLVTARDPVYSWNRVESHGIRTIAPGGGSFPLLDVVKGYAEAGGSGTLAGLAAADDHTLVVSLSRPAGYWLEELAGPHTRFLTRR